MFVFYSHQDIASALSSPMTTALKNAFSSEDVNSVVKVRSVTSYIISSISVLETVLVLETASLRGTF